MRILIGSTPLRTVLVSDERLFKLRRRWETSPTIGGLHGRVEAEGAAYGGCCRDLDLIHRVGRKENRMTPPHNFAAATAEAVVRALAQRLSAERLAGSVPLEPPWI